ncbi:hypothetical protein ACFSTE_14690 [Aquimarina hainanensis]|uniref:MACPF domain-containing protein n=1 Tax=Aquimarina hainanensis TaxID=1578017 RepID=A0ABW5NAP4_9FLAO
MKILIIILLGIHTAISQQSDSDITIQYDSNANLQLGGNIDPNRIFASKQQCLSPSEKEWVDGGAVRTEISTEFLTSHKDISNNFKLSYFSDIKASLNLGDGINARASVNYDFSLDNYFRNISNSLFFVIKAETSHGRIGLKNINLKSEFKQLIAESKFDEFRSACGTHYVRYETKKSAVYAIISVTNIETEIKRHIIAKYAAKSNIKMTGFGSMDSEVRLNIDNLFKELSKHGKVDIKYTALGSEGIKSFSPVVSNANNYDISKILDNLSTALEGFTKESSVPVEYRLASFKPFGLEEFTFNNDKLIYLGRVQSNLNQLYDSFNQIQEIKDSRYDDYLLYFKEFEEKIKQYIELSTTSLKNCYFNNEYDLDNIPDNTEFIKSIVWPSDVFSKINLTLTPHYSNAVNSSGERKETLTSLVITIDGKIRHSNYYKNMTPMRLDQDLKLLPTNGFEMFENNPSIGEPKFTEDNIKYVPFFLRLESFNLNFDQNSNGLIELSSSDVITKQKQLLESLSRRSYIVNIKTTKNENFLQSVDFNFKESDIEFTR